MKRPGKIPDPLTLALHGPSTSDIIGLAYYITYITTFVNILLSFFNKKEAA